MTLKEAYETGKEAGLSRFFRNKLRKHQEAVRR